MNCKKVIPRLSAYQDGELSGGWSRELERHLESCAACQSELAALNGLVGNLCRLTPPAAAPEFFSRIMAGLPIKPEKKHSLLPSLAYTLALLVIFIGGFLLEISFNGQPAAAPQAATTFSAVLTENREMGLLAVQDSTLELLSDLKQISSEKKQDNLLFKLPDPAQQGQRRRI
jgi:anti-sigma factor RsiW